MEPNTYSPAAALSVYEKHQIRNSKILLLLLNQNPRDAGGVCFLLFSLINVCVTPPGQTKNDTDRKFDTHTPIDLI